MTDAIKSKPQYLAIPPTTDTEYWMLKKTSSDSKTKVFVPIDPELHRALLIEAKKRKPVTQEIPQRRRYDRHLNGRRY